MEGFLNYPGCPVGRMESKEKGKIHVKRRGIKVGRMEGRKEGGRDGGKKKGKKK